MMADSASARVADGWLLASANMDERWLTFSQWLVERWLISRKKAHIVQFLTGSNIAILWRLYLGSKCPKIMTTQDCLDDGF